MKEGYHFNLPVALYSDGSHVTNYSRHNLIPVIFTLLIFKYELQTKRKAWRLLGYIPDLELSSKAQRAKANQTVKGKGRSARNFHKMLQTVLKSFIDFQNTYKNGYPYYLRMGGKVKKVWIHCYLSMITGDGKSGDQICGRKLGYTNVARISRKCDCPQAECDDTNQVCQSIQSENVRLLVERALSDNRNDARAARKELDAMTQHVCDLAPFQLSFGGDPTGVLLKLLAVTLLAKEFLI